MNAKQYGTQKQWNKDNYTRLNFYLPTNLYNEIKASGTPLNKFLKKAILFQLAIDEGLIVVDGNMDKFLAIEEKQMAALNDVDNKETRIQTHADFFKSQNVPERIDKAIEQSGEPIKRRGYVVKAVAMCIELGHLDYIINFFD